MSMFSVRTSGEVVPLQWDSEDDSDHEEKITPRTKRARLNRSLKAARAKCLSDDDDDLEILEGRPGRKGSDSEDDRPAEASTRRKGLIPSPCFKVPPSSKPATASLDPVLQRKALQLEQMRAQLRRQAAEAALESSPEPEEEEPAPSGKDATPAEPEVEEPRILLKIKSAVHHDGFKMRIAANAPFRRLYKGYEEAGEKGEWLPPGAKVALLYDGEKLDPDHTPKFLDMEDSDVIDARW